MLETSINDVHKTIFSFEKLPRHGKEYWFFLFTSNNPKNGRQFMLTFGDQNISSYIVDDCKIKEKYSFKGGHKGPSSYLFYDRKMHRFPTLLSSIDIKRDRLEVKSGKREILFEGKYPNYVLKIKENGKVVCNLKTKKGSDYTEHEVIDYFSGDIGAGYINLLLDFRGKLNGSAFSGHGYVQKVISTAPIPGIPWYWCRIYFPGKYILDFLQPHVSVLNLSKEFTVYGYFYDIRKKRKYSFENIKVSKYGKKNRQFLVHGKSRESEFTIMLDRYAKKRFSLNSVGKLTYEQNLVTVSSFSFETKDTLITKKDTGEGIGIMEDAYGYIL